MSDTDSFIDEVNEEVRRDQFYGMLRKYGWIAGLVIIAIVGGAGFLEYRKAQSEAAAEALGDAVLAAMSSQNAAQRAEALDDIVTDSAQTKAIVAMLTASEAAEAGDLDTALAALSRVATDGDAPLIYQQIAGFKAAVLQMETLEPSELRLQFEALAQPGQPLRLLAQEQLALLDIADGDTNAALDRLQLILQDAQVSADLQQRVVQVIVALGGTPDVENLPGVVN